MAFLTKKQIMESKDIITQTVPVPEWGGDVLIRTLTGTERDAFEALILSGGKDNSKGKKKEADMTNIRARLVARSIIDDSGRLMFNDGEVDALGRKSSKALDRVFEVSQQLSGIKEEDIEELEKNSEAAPGGDSTSD